MLPTACLLAIAMLFNFLELAHLLDADYGYLVDRFILPIGRAAGLIFTELQ
jgi:hypothetical protein